MRIALCSDIHLEFGPIQLENTEDAEVLILSGDICVAADLGPVDTVGVSDSRGYHGFHEFMAACSANFSAVVYVMGNHEHYHGDFAETQDILRKHLKLYPNVHMLEKQTFECGDFLFVGGTLWTNFDGGNKGYMQMISGLMNDYRGVKNSNRKVSFKSYEDDDTFKFKERPATFAPEDSYEDHLAMMGFLAKTLEDSDPHQKVIMVGHHSPSKLSIHPRYAHDRVINSAYSSHLDDFILANPRIKLWTHGHTHEPFDYMIGSTRVVCNPRGYINYEYRADEFELKFLEV